MRFPLMTVVDSTGCFKRPENGIFSNAPPVI